MPWIAYGRVTIDYLPGKFGRVHAHALSRQTSGREVRGERRRKETTRDKNGDMRRKESRRARAGRGDGDRKPLSWYNTALSRSQAELDLLGSNRGSRSPPTATNSLGATIGLGLEISPADAASPRLATAADMSVKKSAQERKRRPGERKENVGGDKQERISRRRRHGQDLHRGRQKRKTGSTRNLDVDGQEEQYEDGEDQKSPGPLMPAVYPFHYAPYYPYTYPYTAFVMPPSQPPSIVSAHTQAHSQSQSQLQTQTQTQRPETSNDKNLPGPGGRSSAANHTQQPLQPLFYNPHPMGYTVAENTYQPMVAPSTTTAMMAPQTQVYLLHSVSHGQPPARMQQPSASRVGGGGSGVLDSGQQQALEQ